MAYKLENKPPIFTQAKEAELDKLRNMSGISLVLGRVADSDTIQNSSESMNNFKNSMAYAQTLTWSDFSRVAAVQPGERKFASSVDRPTAYESNGGTSMVEQQSGKSYTLDGSGYLHLILGNSNLNWDASKYGSESFAKEIPSYKGNGIHTTSSGWVYATVGKMFDGINDEAGTNWFPVTNWKDSYDELKGLNLKGEKAQSTRICGSANEQTTGTCCLYYKDNYYDSVAGVAWSAGDYYKCVCAKCYHCLEMARSLDMDYSFTKFDGSGPTGGTGERCQDCDLDNYPSNCGPCPCTLGTYDKFDVLLNDRSLPEKGLAKSNARIAKNWNHDLAGTVVVHCNLDMVDYTKREISTAYWGKDKILEFVGPQAPGKTTKTVCRLATETMNNKEYIIGLTLETTGQYTSMPEFPIEQLLAMVPGIDASHFRMVMLPDFSLLENVTELVGGTRVQISTTVTLSDIARKTSISNFNTYAVAVPKTTTGRPYFESKNNLATSSRLTYKVEANKTVTLSTFATLAEAEAQENGKKNTQISTTSTGRAIVANSKAITLTKTDLEMYAGNAVNFTQDFEYVDDAGDTWSASNIAWLKPTSATTGEELDAMSTDILHVNGFSLNIPDGTDGPAFGFRTVRVTLTI
jgi:hypothetical protein